MRMHARLASVSLLACSLLVGGCYGSHDPLGDPGFSPVPEADGGRPHDPGDPSSPPADDGAGIEEEWPTGAAPAIGACEPLDHEPCACGDGRTSERDCWRDGSWGECRCPGSDLRIEMDAFRARMVGHWRGWVWTPWVAPYPVELWFEESGLLRVRSRTSDPVLYWGDDRDDPERGWRIDDLQASGLARGSLTVVFGSGAQPIALERAQTSAEGARMTFQLTFRGEYGPLDYVLERVGP